MDYIHHWNESGKRFVWAKTSEEILAVARKASDQQACGRLRDTSHKPGPVYRNGVTPASTPC